MRGTVAKRLRGFARIGGPPSSYHRRYARLKRNWKAIPSDLRSLKTVGWLIQQARASLAAQKAKQADAKA